MRALRIPRKDHDVYCIDITRINGKSKLQTHIEDQLLLLHPVYGTHTAVDIKKLKHKEHEWAIVTVMQKEILEEYRILYPHTAFVTATSLAIFAKDFFTQDAYVCGCERIWFDAQRQIIISEEAERAEYGMEGDNTDGRKDELSTASIAGEQAGNPQEREEPVPRAGRRSIVFARKQNIRKAAGIGIGVMLAAAVTAYTVWRAVYPPRQKSVRPEQQAAVEINAEKIPAITPSRFLEIIAEHVPAMQAVFERYRYADAEGVLCTFRSGSLENSITAFQNVPYRTGCTIQEIVQKAKETVVTIQTEPMFLQAVFVPEIDPTAIARFTDALKTGVLKADTVIRREQNGPITMNGLTIALSVLVKTETIDAFLHAIEVISDRYSFGMNLLEVVAVDLEMLSVHAEFQRIGESDSKTETERISGHSSYAIAYAFGYAEKETVKAIPKQAEKSIKKDAVIPEGSVEIGKIQTDGKIKIYYRTPTGKIISIEGKS